MPTAGYANSIARPGGSSLTRSQLGRRARLSARRERWSHERRHTSCTASSRSGAKQVFTAAAEEQIETEAAQDTAADTQVAEQLSSSSASDDTTSDSASSWSSSESGGVDGDIDLNGDQDVRGDAQFEAARSARGLRGTDAATSNVGAVDFVKQVAAEQKSGDTSDAEKVCQVSTPALSALHALEKSLPALFPPEHPECIQSAFRLQGRLSRYALGSSAPHFKCAASPAGGQRNPGGSTSGGRRRADHRAHFRGVPISAGPVPAGGRGDGDGWQVRRRLCAHGRRQDGDRSRRNCRHACAGLSCDLHDAAQGAVESEAVRVPGAPELAPVSSSHERFCDKHCSSSDALCI